MRIAQITPGVIPIPPNGWGAVEKIIWEYTKVLRNLGHHVEILYADQVVKGEWDIVHVHMANLAIFLQERGIPYVFSHHDHHAFHYGKDSEVYQQNRKAIQGSVFSFVHAKYLVDYFDVPGKIRYLGHGANLEDYGFRDRSVDVLEGKTKLVMMANNGLAGNHLYDRKGFGPGIEAAKKLSLPITIICRSQGNSELIETLPKYNGLTVMYDLNYEEAIREIDSCHVFLNPSMLEAGHPNLTVSESICMGIPVVGTSETRIPGTEMVTLNNLLVSSEELSEKIKEVIHFYSSYVLECKHQRGLLSWEVVVSRMLMDYAKFAGISQKTLLLDSYKNSQKREDDQNKQPGYYARFTENPYLYKAKETNSDVSVSFIDRRTDEVIHKMILGSGPRSWISPSDPKDRFVKWRIEVKEGVEIRYEKNMDLEGQHVLVIDTKDINLQDKQKLKAFSESNGCYLTTDTKIDGIPCFQFTGRNRDHFYRVLNLDQIRDYFIGKNKIEKKTFVNFAPSALGDNIAFLPYVNELGRIRGKKVYVKSAHKDLFEGIYEWVEFVDDIQCTEYILVNYLFDVPLQRGFSNQLGLEYQEIRPRVRDSKVNAPAIKGKYVCFSTHSTAQAKNWNNNQAWTKLCEELTKCKITPVCIDRHKSFGIEGHWNEIPQNCLDLTGGDLDFMISVIDGCEFFVGLSSGLSWLAHARGKSVILISGVTIPENEFTIDCVRIHKDEICNSCFNNPKEFKFDPGNWLWCPVHGGTSRQFECTKKISAKHVMDKAREAGYIGS